MTKSRSTTGCQACKRKRRKCDEGKPRCQRCISSGEPCSYEYVDHPDQMPHLIQRTKPAPRPLSERRKASRGNSTNLERATSSFPAPVGSVAPSNLITNATLDNGMDHSFNIVISPGCTVDPLTLSISPLIPDPYLYQNISPNLALGTAGSEITHDLAAALNLGTELEGHLQSEDCEPEFDKDHDRDPERIQALLCIAPTMDKNLKENTVSFVLQAYSQWAIAFIFEPLKIVHAMKDHVIELFSLENTRTRTILIANVMCMFAKNPLLDNTGRSLVAYLALEVHENTQSLAGTPHSSVLARRDAMRVLDHTLEIMTFQVNTRPLATCIQLLEGAAPVFQRACSDPLDIVNILLDPSLNLRHFISADIMKSVTTGRPTCFKYQVAFSTKLCERMFQLQENHGLQWLHGLPDQFIMIFAWINSLCEIPGAGVDADLITWVETEIVGAKIALNPSDDPALTIGRAAVQEGWRNATLIYLYMVLCKADAGDLRVARALKNFMRLVNGVKPGRIPDTYLANPMLIAGVAACKNRDRRMIRQRILNVPECSVPETAGYDAVLQLEDIWARTRREGRAAIWADLRIACFVVTGL